MNDQELQKIAERCVIEINDGQKIIHNIQNKVRLYNPILNALTQVRDAQSCSRNQHATQFCSQAEGLAKKLELAVDVLERVQYLLGEKDFSLIGEALEKIKGSK